MTKTYAITDEQIEQLWYSASEAGDLHMAAICARALGEDYSQFYLTPSERAAVDAMTVAQARAECERVIRNAQAWWPS